MTPGSTGIRVAGVNLPANKHVVISLTAIYGIGPTLSKKICTAAEVNPATKTKDLSEAVLDKIRLEVSQYKVESELHREVVARRRRLEVIKCYRGIRHLRHLPVRGQRTRTNARTCKGPRKIIRKN
jgi:small subunit ribosomal protein S13